MSTYSRHPHYILFREPVLNTSSAHLISFSIAAIYVGSIYFSQRARLSLGSRITKESGEEEDEEQYEDEDEDEVHGNTVKGTRDDPDIIRARMLAVSVSTVLCVAVVFGVLWHRYSWKFGNMDATWDATVLRLGLPQFLNSPDHFRPDLPPLPPLTLSQRLAPLLPHLVLPVLFSGPLFATYLSEELPGQRRWRWKTQVIQRFFTVHGMRNYIIGPITEEVVFRGCILAVWHLADAGLGKMIGLAPLTFGLAHAHHVYEAFHLKGGDLRAAKQALLITLFQLSYTTVFGALVSFIFLRTGSIFPAITAHMFCNVMGFPDIGSELRRFPHWQRGIKAAYVLGIVGFVYTLNHWTVVSDNLYWPRGEAIFLERKY